MIGPDPGGYESLRGHSRPYTLPLMGEVIFSMRSMGHHLLSAPRNETGPGHSRGQLVLRLMGGIG